MATFLLTRHAHTHMVGEAIAGRMPGIGLTVEGRAQAEALAQRLAGLPIERICSSPLQRARETAEPLARHLGLAVEIDEGFDEIDVGAWEGVRFDELDADPHWQRFNRFRSGTRTPGGELIGEVQMRMVAALERLHREHPGGHIAVVSHGDPIKSALAYYAGIPLDLTLRIEVGLASVSVLALWDDGAQIRCINHTGDLPPL
jgi:broad specificity phosphatase PhoE